METSFDNLHFVNKRLKELSNYLVEILYSNRSFNRKQELLVSTHLMLGIYYRQYRKLTQKIMDE